MRNKEKQLATTLSIWCGFLISLGALAYLLVGGPLGAILFSFGLITVTHTGRRCLYTGWVGICNFSNKEGWGRLFLMLFWNTIGVCLGALLTLAMNVDVQQAATTIVENRLEMSHLEILSKSLVTGVIMHCCVWMAIYKQTVVPILIGVPLFILCGLPHCIADVFYYSIYTYFNWDITVIVPWVISIMGNTIGCNLPGFFNDDLYN